ncbi:T9SS type A sorting domain-containing protein [Hymenobacter perfusus]|uniref:T9SS C-terminal target domain-containing protein n=1 Tax=Hymenobacter perfusus TaxID=1236770 RepID=A0A3R9MMM5_9BACT|nr:T9SS type A sorting domain-containing protein [Hymenobacter perfusus]RSK45803.1 T9SS C-terminal target domain-containing protein [Hymenobacter perfusus]
MNATLGTFRGGTINNTGSWGGNIDGVTAATTVANSGTWASASRFNGVAAPLTLTNASGSTWSTTINTGAGSSLDITNNGTWNVGLGLSPGTNRFTNTNTATFPTLGFNGTSTQLVNQGSMTFGASRVDVQSTATITNSSGATLTTNALSINSTATLTNAGTVQATTFYNDQGTTTNTGVLRTSADFFNYSGTVTNTNRIIVAGAFTNNGTFAGPAAPGRGSVTVAGASTNTGTFGVSGRLDFCDAGNPTSGFDTQNGTVGATTTFCSATPLPVTLVSFSAVRQSQGVLVKWSTAMEMQNAYFVVERGANAENFQPLAKVKGMENGFQGAEYVFLDEQPLVQLTYYRLRQVDTDGTGTYSSVVVVTGPETSAMALVLLPNPAQQYVQVQGAANRPIQLLDMTGRVLRMQPAGNSLLQLSGVKPGLYLVRTGMRTARLVVE